MSESDEGAGEAPRIFGIGIGLWFWRRLLAYLGVFLCFIGAGAALVLIATAADGSDARIMALMWMGLGFLLTGFAIFTFYFSGATVTQWAALVAAAVPGMRVGFAGVQAGPTPAPQPAAPDTAEEAR